MKTKRYILPNLIIEDLLFFTVDTEKWGSISLSDEHQSVIFEALELLAVND